MALVRSPGPISLHLHSYQVPNDTCQTRHVTRVTSHVSRDKTQAGRGRHTALHSAHGCEVETSSIVPGSVDWGISDVTSTTTIVRPHEKVGKKTGGLVDITP